MTAAFNIIPTFLSRKSPYAVTLGDFRSGMVLMLFYTRTNYIINRVDVNLNNQAYWKIARVIAKSGFLVAFFQKMFIIISGTIVFVFLIIFFSG